MPDNAEAIALRLSEFVQAVQGKAISAVPTGRCIAKPRSLTEDIVAKVFLHC
jgi:hypothetical protein